ncbi:GNAT family N-acetyltransferase [Macrococcus carouselicus]|uniref:GNAT family N-acetyltransferase n=1 Tax=Macrococcus carouselicus TaxID=69969 RepID=A0A9Q8CLJ0_9STAP|nr:GNAT family N-acetyltransferase [Macrococcus carouselicus]TDM02141.1 GNAT family N-acetyltransferase [Macrococcus carouselicus]
MYTFRNVEPQDLEQIARLESRAFVPGVADTREVLEERIDKIAETFIVVGSEGEIAGFINGPMITTQYITDDLFKKVPSPKVGKYLSVLGLVVSEEHQRQGLAGKLLEQFTERARELYVKAITLTCTEDLVPFYERYGFKCHGPSSSQHGGEQWFNMVKEIK